jgi:hypothetical protein
MSELWTHERTPEPVQNTAYSMTSLKERRIAVYRAYHVISVTALRLM